jgi:hypothetical protein
MIKLTLGGLILFLVTTCAPTPIPVPPVDTKTPEPKFWQEFPIMPGGVEIEDNRWDYHYTVISDINDVVKFYREQMQNTKWELVDAYEIMPLEDMESAEMLFADAENIVSLQIWSKAVLTHVVFIMDSRYPTPKP